MAERIKKEKFKDVIKLEAEYLKFQYFQDRARKKKRVSFEMDIGTMVPTAIRKTIRKKEHIYEKLSDEDDNEYGMEKSSRSLHVSKGWNSRKRDVH